MWIAKPLVVAMLLVNSSGGTNAQEQPSPAEPQHEFVSGTVTELPPGRIVVNRAVLGQPPENRSFLITSETKIEGQLQTGARVTVGFIPTEEGDVAVRIIVRSKER